MAIRTLAVDTPLEALFHERIFTLTALQAFPLGAPFVPEYSALDADWLALQAKQHAHELDSAAADALITRIDQKLASLVYALSLAVLKSVAGDHKAPLYMYFFGTLRPSAFKTPIRMSRLGIMTAWLPALAGSSDAAIKAIGADLTAVLADAHLALKANADAADALLYFDTAGDRKLFVDGFNSKRKATQGALAKMPHDHPELNLPLDFADGFFIHGKGYKAPTLAKIDARIEHAEQVLQLLVDQKAELKARADDAAKAAAAAIASADAAALKAAEVAAAEAAAKVAALKAKGGGAAPASPPTVPTPTPTPTPATGAPAAAAPSSPAVQPSPAGASSPPPPAVPPPAVPAPTAPAASPVATATSHAVPPSPPPASPPAAHP